MRAGMRRPIIALGLVLATGPAQAADVSQPWGRVAGPPPHASVAQILAARGGVAGPLIQAVYVTGVSATGDPSDEEAEVKPELPWRIFPATDQGSFEATVGPDLAMVSDGQLARLSDAAARRLFTWKVGDSTFHSASLFADIRLRDYLHREKRALRTAFEAMIKDPVQLRRAGMPPDAFWSESQLGLMPRKAPPPLFDAAELGGGVLEFRYDGRVVTRYQPAGDPLAALAAPALKRILRLAAQLHPAVLERIGREGRLPARLTFIADAGGRRLAVDWTLKDLKPAALGYPLAAGMKPAPPTRAAESSKDIKDLVQLAWMTAQGKAPSPRLGAADYRAGLDRSMAAGAGFQAGLWLLEGMQMHGLGLPDCNPASPDPADCRRIEEFRRVVATDPQFAAFSQAMQLDGQGKRAEAYALLAALPRNKVERGFVVGQGMANVLTYLKPEQGQPATAPTPDPTALFLTTWRSNPHVPNYHKDVGDHFVKALDMELGWYFYDIGRALPDRLVDGRPRKGDVLASVDDLEAKILEAYAGQF